jgi:hypothetical protein
VSTAPSDASPRARRGWPGRKQNPPTSLNFFKKILDDARAMRLARAAPATRPQQLFRIRHHGESALTFRYMPANTPSPPVNERRVSRIGLIPEPKPLPFFPDFPSQCRKADRHPSLIAFKFSRGAWHSLESGVVDIEDVDRFLRQAVICREESIKALSLIEAASWLRLADDFEKRANRQRSKGRRPPSLWIESPSVR